MVPDIRVDIQAAWNRLPMYSEPYRICYSPRTCLTGECVCRPQQIPITMRETTYMATPEPVLNRRERRKAAALAKSKN